MPECIIRRMTMDDLDDVARIEEATFTPPWSRSDFEGELTRNAAARYLVAEVDGIVIGFAGTWIIIDESRVTNIAIDESMRGNGYGRAITSALVQYAANLGAIVMTLEVRVSNAPAIALYRSLGFKRVNEIKKHYSDGESAWLMLLDHMPPADPDFEEEETLHEEA